MSEIINRGVEALKRLPVRDRENPGSELDELRLREAVRAVIEAMREPTDDMIRATEEGAAPHIIAGNYDEAWRVMIDAALK